MSPKKIPLPISKKKMAAGAIIVVQQLLANEEVRKRLADAPRSVMDWAAKRRVEMKGRRVGVTDRFGHKGLEGRVDSLERVVDRAFPAADDPGRVEMAQAIESLRIALAVAKPMPLVQRRKAQARIDRQLDDLEAALVDAVLPRPDSGPAQMG
jgi:hypothetical protein